MRGFRLTKKYPYTVYTHIVNDFMSFVIIKKYRGHRAMKGNATENKSLFEGYSRKKLYCLADTYEELAKLYRDSQGIDMTDFNGELPDRKDILHLKELNETKQIFASYLEEMSGAFANVADTVMQVSTPLEHKKRQLVHYLKRQGVQAREIIFMEDTKSRRISIEARSVKPRFVSVYELAGLLSGYFGRRLVPAAESAQTLLRGYGVFVFEDEANFSVLSAVSRAVREDEKISGDNFSIEEYNQNQMVAMVSDGMGSGEQACGDSRRVIEFMEKFLEAGFAPERALSMANGAFFSQNPFGSIATLDMCAINLLNGEAEFTKAGAASSYVRRGFEVQEISADSLPLGSVEEINTLQQCVQLYDSDMLVMVSDGVEDAFDGLGGDGLKGVIARTSFVNPRELADFLLQYAINSQGGHIRDDMTVLAMYIREIY